MKMKRILSLLMTLVLCLSLLPVSALAADDVPGPETAVYHIYCPDGVTALVDGREVTEAPAGTKVTLIRSATDSGWPKELSVADTQGYVISLTDDSTFIMPADNVEVEAGYIGFVEVDTWADLKNELEDGNYVRLTEKVTRNTNESLSGSGVLDLNGHTLDGGERIGLPIIDGGSLTVLDSSENQGGSILYYVPDPIRIDGGSSSLTLAGGSIEPVAGLAGGIVVDVQGGNFTMTGGSITGGNIGVFVEGSFTMTGGSITGNRTGVQMYGSFNVSGNPVVTGNGHEDEGSHSSNVVLRFDKHITITGPLEEGAVLSVRFRDGNAGVVARAGDDYALTKDDISHFSSDDSTYTVTLNNDGEAELMKLYTIFSLNDFTAIVNGQEVTAERHGYFVTEAPAGAKVTLIPPEGQGLTALTVTTGVEASPVSLEGRTFTMPADDVEVTAEFAKFVDVENWNDLRNALDCGENVRLIKDVIRDTDESLSGSRVLDLNGHTLDGGIGNNDPIINFGSLTILDYSEKQDGSILYHADTPINLTGGNGTSLTLAGGSIKPAEGAGGGTVVYVNNGSTFTMTGGSITGNGTGVELSGGSFIMTGGSITGNETGVELSGGSSFTMTGGSITGNGTGVEMNDSFNVSGSPVVTGNGSADDPYSGNVLLDTDKTITVTGHLVEGADLGVTIWGRETGVVARAGDDYALIEEDISHFSSDDPTYTVALNNDGEAELVSEVPSDWPPPVTCTVTFNVGAHGTAPEAQTVNAGATAVKPEDPTAPGYTFNGWCTEPQRINIYDFETPVTEDLTLYAKWIEKSSSGGGGSGSGACSIKTADAEHGTVTVSLTSAAQGQTVTVTVKPDEGYKTDSVTVTDRNGKTVEVRDNGSGTWSFTMPGTPVNVAAVFVPDNGAAPEPGPEPTPDDKEQFTDVAKDAWYHDAVYWAVEKGITNGTDATHFSPDLSCTRDQMVTFLWRAAGEPEAAAGTVNPFTDVSADAYYYDAVLWAVEKGIIKGTSETTFSPDDTVTRAQTVTFLYRYEQSTGGGFTGAWAFPLNYSDASDVPEWAYEAFCWMTMEDVIQGTDGKFLPNDDCLRSQIVTMLCRYFSEV